MKKEFIKEDFSEIYNKRWNEEVYFNFQKHVLEIENFSGKTKETVLQDYYSRILVGNLHSLLISKAQEEIEKETKKNKKLKYEKYKINKSVTYGLFRDRLYDLLTRKRYQKQYRALLNEAKRHKVPIIDNRNFPREKKGNLKFNFLLNLSFNSLS